MILSFIGLKFIQTVVPAFSIRSSRAARFVEGFSFAVAIVVAFFRLPRLLFSVLIGLPYFTGELEKNDKTIIK